MYEAHGNKAFGYQPKAEELAIESRHLGLITPSEIKGLSDKLDKLADMMEQTIDVAGILRLPKPRVGGRQERRLFRIFYRGDLEDSRGKRRSVLFLL